MAPKEKAPKKKKEKEEKPKRQKKAKVEEKEAPLPEAETESKEAAEKEEEVEEKQSKKTAEPEEEAVEEKAEAPEKETEAAEEAPPEEEELEIVEEKFYDLNMRKIWNTPRKKRTPRAVRFLREFIARRMKTDDVSISEEANQMLWARGISKPPRKIRVRAVKDKEGRVIVFPGEGK